MGKFCPSCGHEQENPNNKFCSKCGGSLDQEQQNTTTTANTNNYAGVQVMCKRCRTMVPAGQFVCPNCGAPINEEKHTAAIVIGYICATVLTFLFGIFGLIASIAIGIYLYTRDNQDVHKHGLIIIGISVILFIITVVLAFAVLATASSYYYY